MQVLPNELLLVHSFVFTAFPGMLSLSRYRGSTWSAPTCPLPIFEHAGVFLIYKMLVSTKLAQSYLVIAFKASFLLHLDSSSSIIPFS